MQINKIIHPSVGADLSALGAFSDIRIISLKPMMHRLLQLLYLSCTLAHGTLSFQAYRRVSVNSRSLSQFLA